MSRHTNPVLTTLAGIVIAGAAFALVLYSTAHFSQDPTSPESSGGGQPLGAPLAQVSEGLSQGGAPSLETYSDAPHQPARRHGEASILSEDGPPIEVQTRLPPTQPLGTSRVSSGRDLERQADPDGGNSAEFASALAEVPFRGIHGLWVAEGGGLTSNAAQQVKDKGSEQPDLARQASDKNGGKAEDTQQGRDKGGQKADPAEQANDKGSQKSDPAQATSDTGATKTDPVQQASDKASIKTDPGAQSADNGADGSGAADNSQGIDTIKIKAGAMEFDPSHAHLHQGDGEIFVFANSSLSTDVNLNAPARSISIFAHADRAAGEWPKLTVSVDGTPMGEVVVNSTQEKKFYLPIYADPGQVNVQLTYTNDLYDPAHGKDRNVYVGGIKIVTQAQPPGK